MSELGKAGRAKLVQAILKMQTSKADTLMSVVLCEAPTDPQERAQWVNSLIRVQVAYWMDDGFCCCECGWQAQTVDEFIKRMTIRSFLPWAPATAFCCAECWPKHRAKHEIGSIHDKEVKDV